MRLSDGDVALTQPVVGGLGLPSRRIGFACLFLAAYLGVDWLNSIYPHELLNIPPWNPRPAVGLALVLLGGFRWWPLLALAALSTSLLPKPEMVRVLPDCLVAMTEALVYCGAAWRLKRRFGFDPDLAGFDDAFRFIALLAVAAALMSVFYVLAFRQAGLVPDKELPTALFRYWSADMVGGMVVGPFLLVNRNSLASPDRLKAMVSWECLAQAMLIGWVLFIIFPRTVGSRFYPMFIPLVWIAARYGLTGVASALLPIQLAFIGCITGLELASYQIVKLQILMGSLAATGLLLGAVISERERARRSVIEGEARLKVIIDMAPDGMVLLDEAGLIEMTNRQFEALASAPAAALLGRSLDEMIGLAVPPGADEKMLRRSAGGGVVSVETSTAAIEIDGRLTRVVAVRDVSARRLAAARLGQRRAELESASRSNLTEELAAALAHELNQPLSAVITYTGACQRTLAGTDVPPRALEQLAKAAAQAERAGQVLRRLREFFRNATVEAGPVPLADMVRDVLMLLADEASRIDVRYRLEIDGALVVLVDRLQIEQVLINLVRNSLDALGNAPAAHREVRITARAAADQLIEVSVADSGPGIAREVAEHLFRPFTTTRQTGMGLGLAISRSLVEANGGRLWAEDRSAPGAVLHFTVPAVLPASQT